jgi:hypothetical protein
MIDLAFVLCFEWGIPTRWQLFQRWLVLGGDGSKWEEKGGPSVFRQDKQLFCFRIRRCVVSSEGL